MLELLVNTRWSSDELVLKNELDNTPIELLFASIRESNEADEAK